MRVRRTGERKIMINIRDVMSPKERKSLIKELFGQKEAPFLFKVLIGDAISCGYNQRVMEELNEQEQSK
jgi:hypothetical protein